MIWSPLFALGKSFLPSGLSTNPTLVGVFAFTLVYLYLMALRLRVGRLEERAVAEALSPRVGVPVEELLHEVPQEAPADA